MKVGGSEGSQVAMDLMKVSSQVIELSAKQAQAVHDKLTDLKVEVMQNSVNQVSSVAERKGKVIDNMV